MRVCRANKARGINKRTIPGITGVTISPTMLSYSSVMPPKVEVFAECIRGRILNSMTGSPGAGMKSTYHITTEAVMGNELIVPTSSVPIVRFDIRPAIRQIHSFREQFDLRRHD